MGVPAPPVQLITTARVAASRDRHRALERRTGMQNVPSGSDVTAVRIRRRVPPTTRASGVRSHPGRDAVRSQGNSGAALTPGDESGSAVVPDVVAKFNSKTLAAGACSAVRARSWWLKGLLWRGRPGAPAPRCWRVSGMSTAQGGRCAAIRLEAGRRRDSRCGCWYLR